MKLVITDLTTRNVTVTGEHTLFEPSRPIQPCVGCFGCWIKTPGRCVLRDGYEGIGGLLGGSSELILVSRCVWGSLSPYVKNVLDRGISYVHPNFVIRHGEMHHRMRYDNHLAVSAYLYGEVGLPTEREQKTARELLEANAKNLGAELRSLDFFASATELEGIAL